MAIRLSVLGEHHLDVANSYNSIGYTYYIQKNYVKSLEYYQKALDIQLPIYGEHHRSIANSYYIIAYVYYLIGEYSKALDFLNKFQKISVVIFDEFNPQIAQAKLLIGGIYGIYENYDTALNYLNEGLDICMVLYGERNLNVASCYNYIGLIYAIKENHNKAIEYLKKSLNIYISLYDHNNISTCTCSKTIYETYCKLLQQSVEKKKEFDDFMSEYSFTIDISEGETSSSAQSMSGQYYLLEFGDWNIYSIENLFDKNIELQGKPKDIVVMKDGAITKLEDKVDCQISLKYVGKEEKQRIVESHNKWKKE